MFEVRSAIIVLHCKLTFKDNSVEFSSENINNSGSAVEFSQGPQKNNHGAVDTLADIRFI